MENSKKHTRFEKLKLLISEIEVAMMTTIENNGHMRSRPMYLSKLDFDGTLWFFTNEYTHKVHEIQENHLVNLTFANSETQTFVSLLGQMEVITDHSLFRELWDPMLRAWFPEGLKDPNLAVLRFNPVEAEYWDASDSKMVRFFEVIKTIFTEESPNTEHEKIDFQKREGLN
jgi:general stress protein 26